VVPEQVVVQVAVVQVEGLVQVVVQVAEQVVQVRVVQVRVVQEPGQVLEPERQELVLLAQGQPQLAQEQPQAQL
jgi:hypothetical protein